MTDPLEHARQHLYLIFYQDLGQCGCGYSDEAWRLIHLILTYFADRSLPAHAWRELEHAIGTPGAVHIVMSTLDDVLIEHGTSYRASWLTDKGKYVLWAINQLGVDDLDNKLDDSGYPHGGMDNCTDECWRIPSLVIDPVVPVAELEAQ